MYFPRVPRALFFPCLAIAVLLIPGNLPIMGDAQEERFEVEPTPPELNFDEFGIETTALDVSVGQIRRGETLSTLFARYEIGAEKLAELSSAASGVFDLRRITAGATYRVYRSSEGASSARYFVYQPDQVQYVVFTLDDTVSVQAGERTTEIVERAISGTISHSLYHSLSGSDANPALAVKMAEVYAWQIDFFRIQRGDSFRVIFEEEQLDGKAVGIGRILSAQFTHSGEDYYAFYFDQDGFTDYFDENGVSVRKAFLISPLKFGRISSGYTQNRFHPVLKTNRPHLGTDYAAPTGTPILSVGDGTVTEVASTRGNGRYVKIRHNATYTTAYLHMSRFAKDIRPGSRVRQGDVIGYVGSTGLATGPHVCFRFWKNGVQVDHRRQTIPSADPVQPAFAAEFQDVRDRFMQALGDQYASR